MLTPVIQPYPTDRGWRWLNMEDFMVELSLGTIVLNILVPAGFETDGASIPTWVQRLFFLNPYEPEVMAAALVHDWLTPTDAEIAAGGPFSDRPVFPQTIAAGVFYELMRATSVPLLRRRVYYHAVVAAINKRFW